MVDESDSPSSGGALNARIFRHLGELGKVALPNFRDQITEDSEKDNYKLWQVFKKAFGWVVFALTLVAGLFIVFVVVLIGYLLFDYVSYMVVEPERVYAFFSHAGAFLTGGVAAATTFLSIGASRRKNN